MVNNNHIYKQFDEYSKLSTSKNEKMAENTYYNTCLYLQDYLGYLNNDIPTIDNLVSYLTNKQLAKSSKLTVLKALGAFLLWQRYITLPEFISAKKKFRVAAPSWSNISISEKDISDIIAQARITSRSLSQKRDPAILAILAVVGLRVSQLIDLSTNDIEVADNKYYITTKLLKSNNFYNRQASQKQVDFDRQIGAYSFKDLFGKWLEVHNGHEKLFYSYSNKPLTRNAVAKMVNRYSKVTGTKLSPHTFRHFAGSYLANKYGIERAAVALDHSSITTTQKYINKEKLIVSL